MPTPYMLVSAELLARVAAALPDDLRHELDTSQHTTEARPADDLRADPEIARRLALALNPEEPLSVPALRFLIERASPSLPEQARQQATIELARRHPQRVIATMLLYAQAGMPPLTPTADHG